MNKFNVILFGLLAIAVWLWLNQIGKSAMYQAQLKSVQTENVSYRNEQGQLVSERLAFEGSLKDLKTQLALMKKQGDTLTSKLTAKTNEIHYLKRQIDLAGSGDVVPVGPDTVWKVGSVTIDTPIIAIDTTDTYHSFKFAGNASRYAYQVKVIDNSELISEHVKGGTLVRLVNHNPYVTSSEVTSLIVAKKKTSFWTKITWIAAGLGAGFIVFR